MSATQLPAIKQAAELLTTVQSLLSEALSELHKRLPAEDMEVLIDAYDATGEALKLIEPEVKQ